MSGTVDTSQPEDRIRFLTMLAGIGTCPLEVAQAVQNCTLLLPDGTAGSLDLNPGATFAQGAARMISKLTNGQY